MNSELVRQEPREIEVVKQEISIGGMLEQVIKSGITVESAAAMEKLCDLYERMEDKRAEREFAAAFVALQGATGSIQATRVVPNTDGTARYKFAPYEEIMATVKPLLQKFGFSVTFTMRQDEKRVVSICTLMHIGGHSKSNEFAVRVCAPPKASDAQADGSSMTYAKRRALCDSLNITVEADLDGASGSAEGKPITPEQANRLRTLVADSNSSEAKFLKYAGAETYEDIMDVRFEELEAQLVKRITDQK